MMVNIGTILSGTLAIFSRRPAAVAIWAAVYFVASVLTGLLAVYATSGEIGLVPKTSNVLGLGGGVILAFIAIYVAFLLLAMVIMNAVFRIVLLPDQHRFAAMRLGWDELRALGLLLLYLIALFVAVLIGELLAMLVAVAVAAATGSPIASGVIGVLLFVALFGLLIWAQVRLSPLFPLSLLRHRISGDEAWALTRGRFWTLFGAYMAIAVPLFVVTMVLFWLFMGDYFVEIGRAGNDPVLMQAAAESFAARQAAIGLPMRILITLISSIFSICAGTLWLGAAASATRALLGERGAVTHEDVYREAEVFE